MERVDLQYLCTAIGNLSGIPVRVYENGIQTFYTSMVDLPKDPLTLCRAEVFAITDHVGYYITPQFHYYGVLNAGTVKLVVGPTRQVMEREQDLRELAFRLDLSGDEAEAMLSGMRSIVRMPVESVLQMLCTINYVFNHERLELKDLRIYEQEQTALISRQVRQQAQNKLDPPQLEHNTYDLEQRLLRMVRKGDTAALRQWLDRAPAVRSGVVAGEPLRQRKNLFIVTVTLVSRAAIQGGMQVEDAFTLSDSYIQQCELTASPERIANLQYRMLLDYAERVERLHRVSRPVAFQHRADAVGKGLLVDGTLIALQNPRQMGHFVAFQPIQHAGGHFQPLFVPVLLLPEDFSKQGAGKLRRRQSAHLV